MSSPVDRSGTGECVAPQQRAIATDGIDAGLIPRSHCGPSKRPDWCGSAPIPRPSSRKAGSNATSTPVMKVAVAASVDPTDSVAMIANSQQTVNPASVAIPLGAMIFHHLASCLSIRREAHNEARIGFQLNQHNDQIESRPISTIAESRRRLRRLSTSGRGAAAPACPPGVRVRKPHSGPVWEPARCVLGLANLRTQTTGTTSAHAIRLAHPSGNCLFVMSISILFATGRAHHAPSKSGKTRGRPLGNESPRCADVVLGPARLRLPTPRARLWAQSNNYRRGSGGSASGARKPSSA